MSQRFSALHSLELGSIAKQRSKQRTHLATAVLIFVLGDDNPARRRISDGTGPRKTASKSMRPKDQRSELGDGNAPSSISGARYPGYTGATVDSFGAGRADCCCCCCCCVEGGGGGGRTGGGFWLFEPEPPPPPLIVFDDGLRMAFIVLCMKLGDLSDDAEEGVVVVVATFATVAVSSLIHRMEDVVEPDDVKPSPTT